MYVTHASRVSTNDQQFSRSVQVIIAFLVQMFALQTPEETHILTFQLDFSRNGYMTVRIVLQIVSTMS